MSAKEVKFHEDARRKMLRGVDILADAVKVTLVRKAAMSCSINRSVLLASPRTG